jgi:uroporphyrin-III C-methyltransferase/precorrin-2 dehydrogenase/sirohydrochlorin ferrochelatase
MSAPTLFPVFLKLAGRRVLVVGGGPVAASKIDALVAAGADVVVVAPDVRAEIAATGVTILQRPFAAADLDGAWFVVAAATPAVNREVAREAEARGIFVNAVDDPPNASAYLGGIVRRDGVTVAISTNGDAPALAGLMREALDAMLPAELDRWMATARAIRVEWLTAGVPMAERRPLLLRALNELYESRETPVLAGGAR